LSKLCAKAGEEDKRTYLNKALVYCGVAEKMIAADANLQSNLSFSVSLKQFQKEIVDKQPKTATTIDYSKAPSDSITSNSMFDSRCHASLQLPPASAPVAFQLFGALYQLHIAFLFQSLGSARTNSLLSRTRSLLPPYLYITTLNLSVTKALPLNDGNKLGLRQRLQTIGGACHGKVALMMTQSVENCNRKWLVESILRRVAVRQVAEMVTGLQMRAEALRSLKTAKQLLRWSIMARNWAATIAKGCCQSATLQLKHKTSFFQSCLWSVMKELTITRNMLKKARPRAADTGNLR
jgi:hypothetical protein